MSGVDKSRGYKHGYAFRGNAHPLYGRWLSMKDRCYNLNSARYKDYGGRGIRVCEEWRISFPTYLEYVEQVLGPKPGANFSIDRINNDLNYEPGNLRWASIKEQNINQRPHRKLVNKDCPPGVKPNRCGRFEARITINKKLIQLGTFDTMEEAYSVYCQAKISRD